MLKIKAGLVVAMLFLVTGVVGAQAGVWEEISWGGNLYEGFERAVSEKKPLIVLYTQGNCKWCDELERELATGPVRQLAQRGVFVRVMPGVEDDKGNYARLRQDLKVDKFPTIVMLDCTPEGLRELGRQVGYFEAQKVVEHLTILLNDFENRQQRKRPVEPTTR